MPSPACAPVTCRRGIRCPSPASAGIQAAKGTSQLIPHCHPLPIEYVGIDFTVDEEWVDIRAEVKAIHRTGVEMEALTAASVAALTLYDMLKFLGRSMTIENVALVRKTGGKSQLKAPAGISLRAGVLVLSDTVAGGGREDGAGTLIRERLAGLGLTIEQYMILPDEIDLTIRTLRDWCDVQHLDLIVSTGGTGLGPRDTTPEAVDSLIERRLPGVEEAMRAHGQERTPYAMLSRGRAGQRGRTVLVALPGSPRAVAECLDALLPALLHAVPMMQGEGHPANGAGTGIAAAP